MKTERSLLGLRDMIFNEIDALLAGESSAQRLSAVSRASGAILHSVKLELEYYKHAAVTNHLPGKDQDLGQHIHIGSNA